MSNTIPAPQSVYTAEVRLDAVTMVAHSHYRGEIDLASLNFLENGRKAEFLDFGCAMEAVDGIIFRRLDITQLPETDARFNIRQRLVFEIENITNSSISFADKRIILSGFAAKTGYTSPRIAIAALTATPGTPFTAKDTDGATLNSAAFTIITDSETTALASNSLLLDGHPASDFALSSSANNAFGEVPTGSIDGTNMIYILANNFAVTTTQVYLNGLRQRRGASFDYVETGANQITFNSAPYSGDTILVDYQF